MAFSARRAITEATAEARAHLITTFLILLISFVMTTTTLLTVGRSAAAERDILAGLDAEGTRLITVVALDESPGISSDQLRLIDELPEVDWVLGLGPAKDIRSGPADERVNVASRELITELPPLVKIEVGRAPSSGEAVVSASAQASLRFQQPAGWIMVDDSPYGVVGSFSANGVIADLDRLVLTHPPPGSDSNATLMYVLVKQAQDVAVIAENIKRLASNQNPELLSVRTSEQLLAASEVVSGEVNTFSRQVAVGAIFLGMLLVFLTVNLALTSRRADMGRRRALGSSRSALVTLVLMMVTIPTLAGVLLGTLSGLGAIVAIDASPPSPFFVLAVITLIQLVVVLGAVPPALSAALRDPVAVLRVP